MLSKHLFTKLTYQLNNFTKIEGLKIEFYTNLS